MGSEMCIRDRGEIDHSRGRCRLLAASLWITLGVGARVGQGGPVREIPEELRSGPFRVERAREVGVSRKVADGARFRATGPGGRILATDRSESLLDRCRAARLALPAPAAFSHGTAVRLDGWPTPTRVAGLTDVRPCGDDERTARLVALADEHGIDEMAHLWSDRPADTLPGALWRLYALRAGIRRDPIDIARAFEVGRHLAPVHEVVAGVGEPPGPHEVQAVADAVLAGAFTGDLGVALERAAAFCRVVSTGWAVVADGMDGSDGEPMTPASGLTRRAADLLRTGVQLELAAARWREGGLN